MRVYAGRARERESFIWQAREQRDRINEGRGGVGIYCTVAGSGRGTCRMLVMEAGERRRAMAAWPRLAACVRWALPTRIIYSSFPLAS
jgi:hypothetical protein